MTEPTKGGIHDCNDFVIFAAAERLGKSKCWWSRNTQEEPDHSISATSAPLDSSISCQRSRTRPKLPSHKMDSENEAMRMLRRLTG
jgi:hypothetical protein